MHAQHHFGPRSLLTLIILLIGSGLLALGAGSAQTAQAARPPKRTPTPTPTRTPTPVPTPTPTPAPPCAGSWNVVPSPNASEFGHTLNGAAALSGNDIWAVGAHG